MIKKGFKGRCQKRQMKKCKEVVRTYGAIQLAYAERLEQEDSIIEFQCNVMLSGLEAGEYSSDFVCEKQNGDLMVRECVERRFLKKPMTVKLLDASREYWTRIKKLLMMFLLQTHFLQPCRLLTIEIILFFLQRNIHST